MDFRKKEQVKQAYEKARVQFSYDYRELLKEYGLTYKDVAEFMNTTVSTVRQKIQSDNISFAELVTLAAALQGTIRILIILPRP